MTAEESFLVVMFECCVAALPLPPIPKAFMTSACLGTAMGATSASLHHNYSDFMQTDVGTLLDYSLWLVAPASSLTINWEGSVEFGMWLIQRYVDIAPYLSLDI